MNFGESFLLALGVCVVLGGAVGLALLAVYLAVSVSAVWGIAAGVACVLWLCTGMAWMG